MQEPIERSSRRFESKVLQDQTERVFALSSLRLDRIVRSYGLFHFLFFAFFLLEIALFAFFFSWLLQSSIVAISLAVILLTLFSYFLLKAYFQTRKPLLLEDVKEEFLEMVRELLHYQEGVLEDHMALATACTRFANSLQGKEYRYYKIPLRTQALHSFLEKLSHLWHSEDVLKMRELLVTAAIDEHLKMVQREPTSLEIHTALANSYVTLSGLYVTPHRGEGEELWGLSTELLQENQRKFRKAAERAIEEFKILNDYAPNDPWIHTQLAYSYHDLQMPEEEMREYELVLKLRPEDQETLFRLGRLYFKQGCNAKGLRVYERLWQQGDVRAQELLTYYGHEMLE